jgi:hypothetical protein
MKKLKKGVRVAARLNNIFSFFFDRKQHILSIESFMNLTLRAFIAWFKNVLRYEVSIRASFIKRERV